MSAIQKVVIAVCILLAVQSSVAVTCPSNCDSCTDSTKCTVCSRGYYLYASMSCMRCINNCDLCSNSNTCDSCKDGYMYGTQNDSPACLHTATFFLIFFGIFGFVGCIVCGGFIYACCCRSRARADNAIIGYGDSYDNASFDRIDHTPVTPAQHQTTPMYHNTGGFANPYPQTAPVFAHPGHHPHQYHPYQPPQQPVYQGQPPMQSIDARQMAKAQDGYTSYPNN